MALALRGTVSRYAKRIGLTVAVAALMAQPLAGFIGNFNLAHAATTTQYQATGFSDLAWAPDRMTPSGGYSVAGNSLTLGVDNTKANPDTWRQTEGVQAAVPTGINAAKATVHIDPTWGSKPVRAGLWLTTALADASDMAWPIIEYTNNIDGYTGVRVYDTMTTGQWTNVAGYSGVADITFEISVNPENGDYEFFANGAKVGGYSAENYTVVKNIIFNVRNSATTVADDYSVTWSGLQLGVRSQQVVAHNTSQNKDYTSLQAAIDEAVAGDTITLTADVTLNQEAMIKKAITLDGANHTVTAPFVKTDNSNNAAFGIFAGATLKNMTIDTIASTNKLHGINIYDTSSLVTIDTVTVKNAQAAVVNNSSNVTLNNLTTSGNSWYAVNVDVPASTTNRSASLTVTGTSTHADATPAQIFVDDATKPITINAPAYGVAQQGVAQVYRVKLAAPTNLTPANGSTVYRHDFSNTWSTVSGAAKYEYTTTYGTDNSQVYSDNSDASNYDVSNPATVVRHNNGSPVSTYNWKVRAVDAYGIAGEWATSTVTYALPSVSTVFTACDAFEVKFSGYATQSARITWYDGTDATGATVGYTDKPLANDRFTWGSGSGKLRVKSVKYVVSDNTGAVTAQGVTNNPAPCSYTTAGWAADGTTFSIGKMNLPASYSVEISWPGNSTTKTMTDMNTSGWWSAGNRINVEYFTYLIKDARGNVIYTSPQIKNPQYVAPIVTVPETGTEGPNPTPPVTTPTTTPVTLPQPAAPLPAPQVAAPVAQQGAGIPLTVARGAQVAVLDGGTADDTVSTTAPTTEAAPAVLGANTDSTNEQGEVLGTTDTRTTTAFGLFGIVWYWWLVALAAFAAVWWIIAAWRRRNNDEPAY